MVATEDDYSLVKSNHSSNENVFSSSSTLPLDSKRDSTQNIQEPQSPGASNYVNIEYFIQLVCQSFINILLLYIFYLDLERKMVVTAAVKTNMTKYQN